MKLFLAPKAYEHRQWAGSHSQEQALVNAVLCVETPNKATFQQSPSPLAPRNCGSGISSVSGRQQRIPRSSGQQKKGDSVRAYEQVWPTG